MVCGCRKSHRKSRPHSSCMWQPQAGWPFWSRSHSYISSCHHNVVNASRTFCLEILVVKWWNCWAYSHIMALCIRLLATSSLQSSVWSATKDGSWSLRSSTSTFWRRRLHFLLCFEEPTSLSSLRRSCCQICDNGVLVLLNWTTLATHSTSGYHCI